MKSSKTLMSSKKQEAVTGWVMLIPNSLGLLVFCFIPIICAIYISFNDYNGLQPMSWVGIENYKELFHDPLFKDSLIRTLLYALMYVPSMVIFSVLLGVLVNSLFRIPQGIVRTLIFFPYCISAVISGMVWKFLLNYQNGYINRIIEMLGGTRQPFFGSPQQALPSIALTAFWIGIGYNMVIMLAAIKDVPAEYYESASLDGANAFQKFFKITLPELKHAITFVLVMSTINSFQVFDQVKVITSGGPNRATQVTVHYIYEKAFKHYDLGYASAIAFVFFIILLVFSFIQLKYMLGKEK